MERPRNHDDELWGQFDWVMPDIDKIDDSPIHSIPNEVSRFVQMLELPHKPGSDSPEIIAATSPLGERGAASKLLGLLSGRNLLEPTDGSLETVTVYLTSPGTKQDEIQAIESEFSGSFVNSKEYAGYYFTIRGTVPLREPFTGQVIEPAIASYFAIGDYLDDGAEFGVMKNKLGEQKAFVALNCQLPIFYEPNIEANRYLADSAKKLHNLTATKLRR